MERLDTLVLQVQPVSETDDQELAIVTQRLRSQLLDLDVESVVPVAGTADPDRQKGLEALVGWLAVRLGKEGLQAVLRAVVAWTTRSGHSVEIRYGADVLKVSRVSSAQQKRLIDDFLARHPSRS